MQNELLPSLSVRIVHFGMREREKRYKTQSARCVVTSSSRTSSPDRQQLPVFLPLMGGIFSGFEIRKSPVGEFLLLVLSPSAAGEKLEDKEEGYIMDDAQHSRPVA